jgi:hypothetical protein
MNRRRSKVAICCPVCGSALTNLDGAAAGIGGIPVAIGAPVAVRTRKHTFIDITMYCAACDATRVLTLDQRKEAVAVSWHDEDRKRLP